ncbi:ETC complex I subunit conserved region-domain-containing protein [Jimgerdemannia flammicorona]|uniref:ETC complex I subunit conserved region-domain-containing protein n=2 Tax=Jimgerdemannia flammicorona TaxID=994334 RepID=A0A433QYH3_9FUNG|nr:ETC complex I subunit conserved region-domain-containing protein [Jimgerdemannia flammicorona]RUS34825.1 ETC complex I subunit conserved region-domain-containing protein [Jimgerdemannia flammicorona]
MNFTRTLLNAVQKTTTGITGIAVHPTPRPHLIKTYGDTLTALSRLPATAVYRQATEALTQHRLAVVESTEDLGEIEAKIGAGQIEEVIIQAEDEQRLVAKMAEWKP